MNNACRDAEAACGVEFIVDRNTFVAGPFIDSERRSYKGRVYFTDFFGNQDDLTISVKVDITEFDRLYLPAVSRALIHPYSDADQCEVALSCMALEEVVANKLKCLIQRRHSHDLFDLVYSTFIDRSIELDRGVVLRTFLDKTIFRQSPSSAKEILLGLPLAFFGGVWEKFIRCPKPTRFGFDRAVEGFKDSIERLFEGVSLGGWREQLYFPSEHRNLIMDAGAGRKLLKLTYNGAERIIEPYSLAYKRPRGKNAREYFYAYDQTGGQTSPPGIRSFVAENVERLEITEEGFEPRYEIELSKAGEEATKGYFGKGFSNTPRPSRVRTRPSAFGRAQHMFKVQCPYCQKIFTRKSQSLALNDHKAPNGYRCGGRSGYRVY
ncbi:nucleotidyl transferase AbiEii/AbiGii toxin family protein [Rhizobium leguminosarum]|uniref:nucleotidyl transferase AbiEii/AbiGii toxin family protein n=1 Tax=Rhizobium leguminosarum TaxID=384 RepID=UPI003F9C0E3A